MLGVAGGAEESRGEQRNAEECRGEQRRAAAMVLLASPFLLGPRNLLSTKALTQ